jgi:hypothetical protein
MATPDRLGEVRFPVSASVIATAIVALLGFVFWHATASISQTALFLAASGAAAGAILGAFYSARGLALNAAAMERDVAARERDEAQRKRTLALHYIARWNDPAMYHVRDTVRELFAADHKSPALLESIKARETNVIHFLNFLEEVGFALDKGGADPDILRETFEGVVYTAWNKLQDWIREVRRVRQRPKIWIKVEELARKWN